MDTFKTTENISFLANRISETESSYSKLLQRLSSGLNTGSTSGNDATSMLVDTNTLKSMLYTQAVRNVSDGISVLNVASTALDELSVINDQLLELANQATSTGISQTRREELDQLAQQLRDEFERIRTSTEFNDIDVLPTTTQAITVQAGTTADSRVQFTLGGDGSTTDFQATVTETDYLGQLASSGTYGSAGSQYDIDIADINNDGRQDLIGIGGSGGSAAFRTYLGNGDGTFAAATSISIPGGSNNSFSLSVEDFDGDSVEDVIAVSLVSTMSDRYSFFKGNANGTFAAGVNFDFIPSGFVLVTSSDVDQDGDIDLVSTDAGGLARYAVLINNGDGTFGRDDATHSNISAYAPTLGDVNGDGDPDLIIGGNSGTISIFSGGTGVSFGFTPVNLTGSGAVSATAVGDLNGDGDADIVAINGGASSVGIFLGNGDGTFAARSNLTTGAVSTEVFIADMTNDGINDIVAGGSTGFSVLAGNGDGTFKSALSVAAGSSASARMGDLNGDGVPDIASQTSSSGVQVFLSTTTTNTTIEDFSLTDRASNWSCLTFLRCEG